MGRTRELELFQLRAGSDCCCVGGDRCRRGQYESNRHNKGSIVGVATGHGASRQSTHVVAAIHGPTRGSGRFAMVMFGDRAVVSGAAIHCARGPCSSGKGSVQKCNRQQAETGGDDWPARWKLSAHVFVCYNPILLQNIPSCMEFAELSSATHAQRSNIACPRTALRRRLALTWRRTRRRLALCTILSFSLISAQMKRQLSRRATSWRVGGRRSGWTRNFNSSLIEARLPQMAMRQRPKSSEPRTRRSLQKLQRPVETSSSWSVFTSRVMKSSPTNAGWIESLPKSLSKAPLRNWCGKMSLDLVPLRKGFKTWDSSDERTSGIINSREGQILQS